MDVHKTHSIFIVIGMPFLRFGGVIYILVTPKMQQLKFRFFYHYFSDIIIFFNYYRDGFPVTR